MTRVTVVGVVQRVSGELSCTVDVLGLYSSKLFSSLPFRDDRTVLCLPIILSSHDLQFA